MLKITKRSTSFYFYLFIICSELVASNGKFTVKIVYDYCEKKLFFQSTKGENVFIGTHTIMSETSKEYTSKIIANKSSVGVDFKLNDKIFYTLEAGIVSNQSAKFEGNSDSKFESLDYGWLVAFNTNFEVFPETVVNPGIFFTTGFDVETYKFNILNTTTFSRYLTNIEFNVVDVYGGLNMRKRLFNIFSGDITFSMKYRLSSMKDWIGLYSISGEGYTMNVSFSGNIRLGSNESIGLKMLISPFDNAQLETSCSYNIIF
ncbi:MAG: hypothetical protein RMJ13_07290 [Elusimicrobiota bacterium]|nr:hypothetical protein [Elusimicrobiota bacterium]